MKKTRNTKKFAEKVITMADQIDTLKANFDIEKLEFLKVENMAKKYIEYIKI